MKDIDWAEVAQTTEADKRIFAVEDTLLTQERIRGELQALVEEYFRRVRDIDEARE